MILDLYFRRPIFWDFLISLFLCIVSYYLFKNGIIELPTKEETIAITTDITTISLTLAGFILTLLTVLITFKSSSPINIKKNGNEVDQTVFSLFFTSGYYFETVRHLKNCIKSLIFIAVFGFAIKLFLPATYKPNAFFFNVIGLGIILLTIWRCVLILSKVLELQREDHNSEN